MLRHFQFSPDDDPVTNSNSQRSSQYLLDQTGGDVSVVDGVSIASRRFIATVMLLVGGLVGTLWPSFAEANRGGNWFDDTAAMNSSGAPSIRINLSEQKAYFYKGGRLVGSSFISSGKKGFRTGTGKFRVLAKRPNHRSSIYGSYVDRNTGRVVRADVDTRKHRRPAGTYYRGAKMNHYIRFNGGIGLHASGHVPRYPASHGCVRMPPHMARKFYQYSRVGMPVTVTY
ncbi:L,D-transpeptidase family protein [Microbulbifer agarilyticus]|uniref:L,D-transpeptidase family protein n=1 Tax=Microbulbifer agarilyticus TaxID=260552 RepID=UPI001CD26878|nr:L,D-transpeptidase family protein [Microbulbifer agarilyticus]MCA0891881.1 L,D-transpeptidase family protein [Microbulbifer agarilyticus]